MQVAILQSHDPAVDDGRAHEDADPEREEDGHEGDDVIAEVDHGLPGEQQPDAVEEVAQRLGHGREDQHGHEG